jgi:predicted nucleic acid-binding protein
MASFCLDGNALAKRYVPEPGSPLVDFLPENVPEHRIYVVNIGAAEVGSVLVRKKNAGTLSVADFSQAIVELESEVIRSPAKHLLSFDNAVVVDAFTYILTHSINATDAVIVGVALDVARHLRNQGDDLVLVASDLRLLRAAQAEGLATFNPARSTSSTATKRCPNFWTGLGVTLETRERSPAALPLATGSGYPCSKRTPQRYDIPRPAPSAGGIPPWQNL